MAAGQRVRPTDVPQLLRPLSRVPRWAVVAFALTVLLLQAFGLYWDIWRHVVVGRESFFTPPHVVLYAVKKLSRPTTTWRQMSQYNPKAWRSKPVSANAKTAHRGTRDNGRRSCGTSIGGTRWPAAIVRRIFQGPRIRRLPSRLRSGGPP